MKRETKKLQEKPRFRTNYNGYKSETDFEKVDPISLTIPNETYSLRDIVEKFSREYPKHLLRMGYSDEIDETDPDFDDVDLTRVPGFDLVDAYEMMEDYKSKKSKKAPDTKQEDISSKKTEDQMVNQPADI